ncbi:MAG: efflux RND transporter periplasmic adaptor subunit [Filomicrobium sp.]
MKSLLLSLSLALLPTTAAAQADAVLEFEFPGQVEPLETARVSNQVDGIISQIHFAPGQFVKKGDVMFSISDTSYRIDVQTAEASLAEAKARLSLAEDIAKRQAELRKRGTGAEARATQSRLEAEIAKAAVARAEGLLAAAKLALERTQIKSPISGRAQRPAVPTGAFVEAEGGTVLGQVVKTDPVLVAYKLSYEDRQKALAAAKTRSVKDMLQHIELSLQLPSGDLYPHKGTPKFESSELDPTTKTLTTWAEFPNPDNALIPGLEVKVMSRVFASKSSGPNP